MSLISGPLLRAAESMDKVKFYLDIRNEQQHQESDQANAYNANSKM